MDDAARIEAALVFAQGEMKTDAQRNALRAIVKGMKKAGDSANAIVITLTCAVLDGLRYGNWPMY